MKRILCLAILCLASCSGTGVNIFGTNVVLVQNRDANGNPIIPTSPNGAPASKSATVYQFKDGVYGVSLWSDGTAPLLSARK